jgi:SM-20-related protein
MLDRMMPDSPMPLHIADAIRRDGYAVVQDFLGSRAIDALAGECRALRDCAQLQPAAVGHAGPRHVDPNIRGDLTHWFDAAALSSAQQRFWKRMDTLRQSLNRELLLGLNEFEAHYAVYPPGARYARHRDRFRDDDARVLSSVLYLNRDWCEADGGALRLHFDANAPTRYLDIHPRDGTLVLFLSADFEHEVLPARRARLSVAGWFRR